jgi:hypothetical protein
LFPWLLKAVNVGGTQSEIPNTKFEILLYFDQKNNYLLLNKREASVFQMPIILKSLFIYLPYRPIQPYVLEEFSITELTVDGELSRNGSGSSTLF